MFTKTQIKIMEIFTSKITEKFSIKQISEILEKPYPLIHRSIKELINQNFILKDIKELLCLNYRENIQELAYIESERKKKLDKSILLFERDTIEKIKLDFFVFLIFGSSVESKNPKDTDILFIIEDKEKVNETEKILKNTAENFTKEFDINVISTASVYEMLNKRGENNIMTETLNKHIILFGAENYYKMLKNA
jgi:hypothetical protein